MKNYKNYQIGEKVKIIFSHSDDMNLEGEITEVRNSFCKIKTEKGIRNHIYGQFKKLQD